MAKKEVFQQDRSQEERAGAVFIVRLLFQEPVDLPDRAAMTAVMERRVGEVDCFWHDEKGVGLAAKQYLSQFRDAAVSPQLMITPCAPFDGSRIEAFDRSQMWDCMDDRDRILDGCKYQIIATDMMAAALPPQERADLDMDFLEALAELFPSCEAVLVHNSGKLLLTDTIRSYQGDREDRFIKFAVNARFFNIEGSDDMLVDTLGMNTLFLPDLQYHFHGMDPNWVVGHAYSAASYILANDNPIKSGDPIDGIVDGMFSQEVMWKCQYEDALIQPVRGVIDINMGEYASGNRDIK